jgi:hypothetical protein
MTSSLWREPRAVLGGLAGGGKEGLPGPTIIRSRGPHRQCRRPRRNTSFRGQKLEPAAREHLTAGGRSRARLAEGKSQMTAATDTSFQRPGSA